MPWERRGDFTGLVGELRARHNYPHEIKWNKVKYPRLRFYKALINYFFDTSRMDSSVCN